MSALAGRPAEAEQPCPTGSSQFRRRQSNCGFIRKQFASGCAKASSAVVLSAVEKAAIASQRPRSSVSSHRMTSRPRAQPVNPTLRSRACMGRGTVQAGLGCRGGAPAGNSGRARRRAPIPSGAWGHPKGARSQPGGRSRNGAWGNWLQARSPRSGAPKARLAAKEETRQAASPSCP